MPSADYRNAIGGGLKLKGVKDSGVSKRKHKKKKSDKSEDVTSITRPVEVDVDQETSQPQQGLNHERASLVEVGQDGMAKAQEEESERRGENDGGAEGRDIEYEEGQEVSRAHRALEDEDRSLFGDVVASNKTEAQRKHDERRKKRLDEKLRREGVKTHKERVEALNKYLSGLSEHHDMPRIGPG